MLVVNPQGTLCRLRQDGNLLLNFAVRGLRRNWFKEIVFVV
ncbi:hypothetical protein [Hymenobacter sp. BT491]|nr:hypothetical protein [Hymenobacter sp. BT491]